MIKIRNLLFLQPKAKCKGIAAYKFIVKYKNNTIDRKQKEMMHLKKC